MANKNPNPATRYTTNRPEPLNAHVAFKVSGSMKASLDKIENPAEFIRAAIEKALTEKSQTSSADQT